MIIAIYFNGDIVVEYEYNPWGNLISMIDTSNNNIGSINPIRYKGYYCDEETGLFMVGHRYYNPEWGRWLTPDDVEYLEPDNINGLNLYCYCGNDPINKYDPTGHFAITLSMVFAAIGVGALIGAGANDINNAMFANSSNIIVNNIMFKGMFLAKSLILYDIALTLGWPATYGSTLIKVLESKPHIIFVWLSYIIAALDGISLLKTIFGNGGSNWILY